MGAGGVILELFCNLVVHHGSWGGGGGGILELFCNLVVHHGSWGGAF